MTAIWFDNHIVSAWYDSDGGRANLWKAYVMTKAAGQNEDSEFRRGQHDIKSV